MTVPTPTPDTARRPRLTVIGTGYLGATHAACMAELGFEVLGLDVDPEKIAALQAARVPFYEPGLAELIGKQIQAGRLRFTTSVEEVAEFGDVHFLCVGTPQKRGEFAADLRYVDAAVEALAPHLRRACVVVGKSTVPVGTAARLAERLAELAPAGAAVELAWNPEFLREGFAIEDTLHPDRLVIGDRVGPRRDRSCVRCTPRCWTRACRWSSPTTRPPSWSRSRRTPSSPRRSRSSTRWPRSARPPAPTSPSSAEALALDPRIGGRFLSAGLGFGGGCLPKDIRAFMARAGELGADQALSFLREVDAINMRRRARMIDLAREQCDGSFLGKRVAVFGAAFKPDSDDIRDSPALNVAASIQLQGAQVTVYDPKANDNARKMYPTLDYADSAFEAADRAHLVLHLTEWAEFAALEPEALGRVVVARRIVDGRNALDPALWRGAGWTYRALGRP